MAYEPKKLCPSCQKSKGHDCFYYDKRSKLGMSSWCKDCTQDDIRHRVGSDPDKYYKMGRSRGAKNTLDNCRRRALAKGLAYDLDEHRDKIYARFDKGVCELSGVALARGTFKQEINSPSLDRIKPERGYIYSNVRIIAHGLNSLFGAWGEEASVLLVRAWLEQRNV